MKRETKKKYVKKRYKLKNDMISAQSSLRGYRSQLYDAEVNEDSVSQRLHAHYYSNNNDSESGYSGYHTMTNERQVIVENAVLLYRPEKLDRETRRDFKQRINTLVSLVITNHSRHFRFQVIGGAKVSFVDSNNLETVLDPGTKFGQLPTLIFWDTKQLSFRAIYPDEEPPLVELDAFIASQQLATKPAVQLPNEFSSQRYLKQNK